MTEIRPASLAELRAVIGWAAAEGWSPGHDDAALFHGVDPEGFLVACDGGAPVASISVVRHGDGRGFLGLYICRPEFRGRGIGYALWTAGMARLADCVVGLDGVAAQVANYRRSGFIEAGLTVRWEGEVEGVADPGFAPPGAGDLAAMAGLDRAGAGYARPLCLERWVAPAATRLTLAARAPGGAVAAFGTIRGCEGLAKIGPLYARSPEEAERLVRALTAAAPWTGGTARVGLDAPDAAEHATALAGRLGFAPGFETARMWNGAAPARDLARVYGEMSRELG